MAEKVVIDKDLVYKLLAVEYIAGGFYAFREYNDPLDKLKDYLSTNIVNLKPLTKIPDPEWGGKKPYIEPEKLREWFDRVMAAKSKEELAVIENEMLTPFLKFVRDLTPDLEEWFIDADEYCGEW